MAAGREDAPRATAETTRRLAQEAAGKICEGELQALAARLEEQLEADARLCWCFLRLRDRAVAHLQAVDSAAYNGYEFNNAFSRFYIAARNALSGSAPPGTAGATGTESPAGEPASEVALAACYRKMQGELAEKKMSPLPWAVQSLAELKSVSACEELSLQTMMQKLQVAADESSIAYVSDASDLKLSVPEAVRAKLKQRALAFVKRRCSQNVKDDAAQEALAGLIFKVTVLNYLVASSSLYWGFGPEVYQKAQDLGAVLECYASPFNHSLELFCSPCMPLDMVFGSLGSFYHPRVLQLAAELPEGALLVANPPYLETELAACVERVRQLCGKSSSSGGKARLRAISIFPKWDGAAGVDRYKEWAQEEGGIVAELQKLGHKYHDYQRSVQVLATFPSYGFGVGCAASKSEKEQLIGLFDVMRCSTPRAPKRQRRENGSAQNGQRTAAS
eukprot:TRINITY_DN25211_c0_g1_i1.p1 TRINITY_DN25211_c0_g1~~TRINITY_DN25211_c0_g1_i1.p1  ORF type:complete len:448 (+),score=127.50 TRINITY_DN25211_c0_g1_i1:72-1415(+)